MNRLTRGFFRAPIALYRVRAGWVLGRRFLLLEHRGRSSGQVRQAVLEVVEATEAGPVVVSGFGDESQWYQNVLADPHVGVTWARDRFEATAVRLDPTAARAVFERYRVAHPRAAAALGRAIGVSLTNDLDTAAAKLPALCLRRTGS